MLANPIKTRFLTDEQGVPNSVVVALEDWREIERLLDLHTVLPFAQSAPAIPELSNGELRATFIRHIGTVDLGRATGTDNEQIDADLIRAYAE